MYPQQRPTILSFIAVCTVCFLNVVRDKLYLQQYYSKNALFTSTQQSAATSQSNKLTPVTTRPDLLFPYFIINNTDHFVTPGNENRNEPEICFIKSSYARSIKQSDRLDDPIFNATQFRQQQPSFRFYLFTNLKELQSLGWTKIITPNLPYKRFITHSRYSKFLAWLLPEIRQCGVVFYMDSHVLVHSERTTTLRELAHQILQSPAGLMQFQHPYSLPTSPRAGWESYGPLDELRLIQELRKDITPNIDASIQWLMAQDDFDNNHTTVYANTYIGYNPKNLQYQKLSLQFWDRYSLELDSWRDQPLWSYMVKKLNITPLLFPANHSAVFESLLELKGHGGHKYSHESNADAEVSS